MKAIVLGFLFFAVFTAGVAMAKPSIRMAITDTLTLNNGLSAGGWGTAAYCEDGSFATAMEVKWESYSLIDTDETAVNAIRLYCSTVEHIFTGYITSDEGKHGEWKGTKYCSKGFAFKMRANVLGSQGILGDDVGVENVQLMCTENFDIITGVEDTLKIPDGEWSDWASCSDGSGICGVETRFEDAGLGDDAGTTDIVMYCCSFNGTIAL